VWLIVELGSFIAFGWGKKWEDAKREGKKRRDYRLFGKKRRGEKLGRMNDEYFLTGHSNLVIFPNWGEYNA
jgi:hypothetical protein